MQRATPLSVQLPTEAASSGGLPFGGAPGIPPDLRRCYPGDGCARSGGDLLSRRLRSNLSSDFLGARKSAQDSFPPFDFTKIAHQPVSHGPHQNDPLVSLVDDVVVAVSHGSNHEAERCKKIYPRTGKRSQNLGAFS